MKIMTIADNGMYLLDIYTINKYAYYDANMEMAVWCDKKGNIYYYYNLYTHMPRMLDVLL